jgi:hypothetical protein
MAANGLGFRDNADSVLDSAACLPRPRDLAALTNGIGT